MEYNVYLFKDTENRGSDERALEYLKSRLGTAVGKQTVNTPGTVKFTGKSCGDPNFNVEVRIGKDLYPGLNAGIMTFNDGYARKKAQLIISKGFGIGVWYSETNTAWTVLACSPDMEKAA